jgi:pilus assembly protein CpaB
MNPRTLIVVALAGVCGLSAMFLVHALRKPQGGPVVEKTGVVFAAADIKPGETIVEAMLEVKQVPVGDIPEDAIRKVADALDRAAQAQLDQGDMIRGKKLAEKGAGRGMAARVKPGMRAFTIQTPSLSGSLAGFLMTGNEVDVLLTINSGGGPQDQTGGGVTSTLLQKVEILAVHTTVSTPTNNKINPDDSRSVTLQVTPEQAALLDLGQSKGTLHLSLRNLKDLVGPKSRPVTMADLQIPQIKPVEVAAAPPPMPELAIRPGMRAFTIQTPRHSSSLVGFLKPGAKVDVLVTSKAGEGGGKTSTLLPKVEVLADHTYFKRSEDSKLGSEEIRAVTLHVKPEDAERLNLGEQTGTLHLTLRNDRDEDDEIRDPVTLADLHRARKIAAPPGDRMIVDPPQVLFTRTMRGTALGQDSLTIIRPARPAPPPGRPAAPRQAGGDPSVPLNFPPLGAVGRD